jgi:ribosome biogenesis GTPase
MSQSLADLAGYGWSPFFTSQLDADELADLRVARVLAVHRSGLRVAGPGLDAHIPAYAEDPDNEESVATVGDWLLLDPETNHARRRLARMSLFKRRAAGTERKLQLIAANVDTLFVVSSCNQDFNVARLERYLALARAAQVTPLVVLTKADLTETPEDFAAEAAWLARGVLVETLDARAPDEVARLAPWCGVGQTVALVGSSGVGKSTLVNTLLGDARIATSGVRADDDKGRHTTTARQLHRLSAGGWLLDTPGMRELQLTDARAGVDDVFADVVALAADCRFPDCTHDADPGCAVREAIKAGAVDADRLKRWRKLSAEVARNTESLAERRARDRALGRLYRDVQNDRRKRRDE